MASRTPTEKARLSRRKGAASERDACRLWQEAGFPFAKRNLTQYQERSGRDIENTEPFVCQVKCGKNINVWKALAEAEAEAKEGEIPLAMVRRDRGEWTVVISWKEFARVINPK